MYTVPNTINRSKACHGVQILDYQSLVFGNEPVHSQLINIVVSMNEGEGVFIQGMDGGKIRELLQHHVNLLNKKELMKTG